MAWEQRGGRQYYYTKRRIGARVVSEYVGGGNSGALTARRAEADKEERLRRRTEVQAVREVIDALGNESEDFSAIAQALTRAAYLIAGYHEHKGQWRRRKAATE